MNKDRLQSGDRIDQTQAHATLVPSSQVEVSSPPGQPVMEEQVKTSASSAESRPDRAMQRLDESAAFDTVVS